MFYSFVIKYSVCETFRAYNSEKNEQRKESELNAAFLHKIYTFYTIDEYDIWYIYVGESHVQARPG